MILKPTSVKAKMLINFNNENKAIFEGASSVARNSKLTQYPELKNEN